MLGLNVIGMPLGMHGLGMELRDKVRAMRSVGIDLCIIEQNYSSLKNRVQDPEIEALLTSKPKYDVNLICHNLPATNLINRDNPELLEGRYNIGAPYWEFPELPEHHQPPLDWLDEIWVSNQFLGSIFARYTDKPIVQMPLHIAEDQTRFKLNQRGKGDDLVFGYSFDCNSMIKRKDPVCLLVAFLEAFSHRPKEKVKLILKYKYEPSVNVRQSEIDNIHRLASLDERIELIDEALSPEDMNALMDSFDVYVSPHRAEGLGRGIVESMFNGKAVAACGYSGPHEFLAADRTVVLDCFETHVGDAAFGDIKSYFTWVDVHIESVVEMFDMFASNPKKAKELGKKAAQFMRKNHGYKHHGLACKKRLNEIEKIK